MRRFQWTFLLSSALASAVAAQENAAPENVAQEKLAPRRHAAGPLTGDDFRAAPPSPLPVGSGVTLRAHTATRLAWDYEYDVRSQGGRTAVRLTSIRIDALMAPEESWNATPEDKALLEHEQGHFDLTAILALRANLQFAKAMKAGSGIVAAGANQVQAVAALEKRIAELMKNVQKDYDDTHGAYDQASQHGSDPEAQAKERQRQKQKLLSLQRAVKRTGVRE